MKYSQAFNVTPRGPGQSELEGHSGQMVSTCSAIFVLSFFLQIENLLAVFLPSKHQLWEIATTNTTEDEHGINFGEKEAIIPIADAIAMIEVLAEMTGLIEDGSHLGRIDAGEIIENLIEGEEIALGDTMK